MKKNGKRKLDDYKKNLNKRQAYEYVNTNNDYKYPKNKKHIKYLNKILQSVLNLFMRTKMILIC